MLEAAAPNLYTLRIFAAQAQRSRPSRSLVGISGTAVRSQQGSATCCVLEAELALLPSTHLGTHVKCDCCGSYEIFNRCRVISKTKGTWRCPRCGSKTTMLRRVFGEWPTTAFALIPEDPLHYLAARVQQHLSGPAARLRWHQSSNQHCCHKLGILSSLAT